MRSLLLCTVVVRGHPGGIPGFSVEIGIWGITDVASLLLGNLAHRSHSSLFFSFVFLLIINYVSLLLRVD